MDLGLEGKTAIICASSKGLGKACAMALAKEGCHVVINGRNMETLYKTAEEIKSVSNGKVVTVVGDISTESGQVALLDACPQTDILINNNGGPPFSDFRDLDREAILAGVTQNMVTPIELIQMYIEGMNQRRFGRIVNITSTSVYAPIAGLDLSSGARAGLTSFLAGIARKVVANNVTINNLLPGPFATDRILQSASVTAQKEGMNAQDIIARRAEQNPAKRLGDPEEFGQACAFLCSKHSGFINGQNLIIDGGAYASAF